MLLEVEGKIPIMEARISDIRREISRLRSYGPSSFATLTDNYGNFVQVAGGGVTCMLERGDSIHGVKFRAYQDKRSAVFLDGTVLAFSGGEIPLRSNEWFSAGDADELFVSFLNGEDCPGHIKWRDITSIFK